MTRFTLTCAAALFAFATSSFAETHMSEERRTVINCLEAVGVTDDITWNQCVGLMFAPCRGDAPGSDDHAVCLGKEHDAWTAIFQKEQTDVKAMLKPDGEAEISKILESWGSYVKLQCNAAALERGGSESARLGCEIAETVSVTMELVACREGRSTAPFCQLKDG